MSAKIPYYVGDDPHGYGGLEEVSKEQARAYAKAIAAAAAAEFPECEVTVGFPEGMDIFIPKPEQIPIHGWVQANWRSIRAKVNEANGWEEQWGGSLWKDTHRC
jgi:hypothetical protein